MSLIGQHQKHNPIDPLKINVMPTTLNLPELEKQYLNTLQLLEMNPHDPCSFVTNCDHLATPVFAGMTKLMDDLGSKKFPLNNITY